MKGRLLVGMGGLERLLGGTCCCDWWMSGLCLNFGWSNGGSRDGYVFFDLMDNYMRKKTQLTLRFEQESKQASLFDGST